LVLMSHLACDLSISQPMLPLGDWNCWKPFSRATTTGPVIVGAPGLDVDDGVTVVVTTVGVAPLDNADFWTALGAEPDEPQPAINTIVDSAPPATATVDLTRTAQPWSTAAYAATKRSVHDG
jgi:hypothetical protein